MSNPFETIDARLKNIELLLLELKHDVIPVDRADRRNNSPLTVQDAADFVNLAVPTIYGLVSRREIPFSKKGKRLYFLKDELTEWIQTGRRKTVAEIEKEVRQ